MKIERKSKGERKTLYTTPLSRFFSNLTLLLLYHHCDSSSLRMFGTHAECNTASTAKNESSGNKAVKVGGHTLEQNKRRGGGFRLVLADQ